MQRFFACVRGFSLERLGALDKLHLHRNLDLQHDDQIFFLAELGHGAGDDFRLFLRVLQRLLAIAVHVVADELQEESDIVRPAFIPDPSMKACLRSLMSLVSKGV